MRYAHIVIRLFAAAAVVTAVIAGVTGPAVAHTELKSSTPKDGATVKKAPPHVELVFTESINRQFVTIAVTGPDGQKVTKGKPNTKGPVVTQPLTADLPNGRYAIAFRVVSSDGHPVSGELHFTLKAPAPPSATPTVASPAAGPSPAGVATPAGAAPSSPAAGTSPAASSSSGGGWTIALVAAVLVVAVAAGTAVVGRRRRGAAGS
ncbi:copper resistance protein CopC [Microbispora sp. NEAU-D428]|uniref:copper resistance CopC family protein n=1 Tax=Microbispora sitophila TaxID=2771537 RepID=UPI00186674C8|nr:copper resistance CopC family protein [Microbispora sitophila]MBE3014018.1 copper resistance protein CopC [Microbispora sitophila]